MNEIAVFRLHKLSFLIRSRFKNKVKVFVLERNVNKECVFDLFCFVLFCFSDFKGHCMRCRLIKKVLKLNKQAEKINERINEFHS